MQQYNAGGSGVVGVPSAHCGPCLIRLHFLLLRSSSEDVQPEPVVTVSWLTQEPLHQHYPGPWPRSQLSAVSRAGPTLEQTPIHPLTALLTTKTCVGLLSLHMPHASEMVCACSDQIMCWIKPMPSTVEGVKTRVSMCSELSQYWRGTVTQMLQVGESGLTQLLGAPFKTKKHTQ